MEKNAKIKNKDIDLTKTRRRIVDAIWKRASLEDVREIADRLGVEMATILTHTKIRPNFGDDQVRCMDQLKKGSSYYQIDREVDERSELESFVIVKEPYFDETASAWAINIEYPTSLNRRLFLQNYNILSYSDGTWNPTNYITFSK